MAESPDGLGVVAKRQAKQKELILEQFKKTPIVQVVCEKTGIGRASYYRWRKDDEAFAEAADAALDTGASLVNDMAESQLIAAIRNQNLTAIIFWLKHHHAAYRTRVELNARLRTEEKLTPEQEAIVMQALKLTALITEDEQPDESEPERSAYDQSL